MTAKPALRIECNNGVMVLTNTDAPWNRMSFAYMDALEQAVIDAATDASVRALIFTADGQENFSVGMDLKQLVLEGESRGGLELPLACHFRMAAEGGAKIGLPELDLGTVPDWGGTARLTRCIGRDRALDMILRVRKIDGPEALRIGLVQSVHPLAELKDAALALARELATRPPTAVAGVMPSF